MTTDLDILSQLEHITEDKSGESAYLLKGKLEGMRKVIDDYLDKVEDAMLKIVLERGRIKIPMGDGHYREFYASHPKTVKCKDLIGAVQLLMGIDLDELENCLSANALKHGTFRKFLAAHNLSDRFDEFFETIVKDKLESGDPKPLELQVSDSRFVK